MVSPLISLMKDQVEQLAQHRNSAVLLNSSLSPEEYRQSVERLKAGAAQTPLRGSGDPSQAQ
ncbi:MAG: hypothetical protein M0C28_05030 [Candidatus Moduliflexus flocculans]|nr:hypothetical protein [Candidatus Moduliflexus flocculans]